MYCARQNVMSHSHALGLAAWLCVMAVQLHASALAPVQVRAICCAATWLCAMSLLSSADHCMSMLCLVAHYCECWWQLPACSCMPAIQPSLACVHS